MIFNGNLSLSKRLAFASLHRFSLIWQIIGGSKCAFVCLFRLETEKEDSLEDEHNMIKKVNMAYGVYQYNLPAQNRV